MKEPVSSPQYIFVRFLRDDSFFLFVVLVNLFLEKRNKTNRNKILRYLRDFTGIVLYFTRITNWLDRLKMIQSYRYSIDEGTQILPVHPYAFYQTSLASSFFEVVDDWIDPHPPRYFHFASFNHLHIVVDRLGRSIIHLVVFTSFDRIQCFSKKRNLDGVTSSQTDEYFIKITRIYIYICIFDMRIVVTKISSRNI